MNMESDLLSEENDPLPNYVDEEDTDYEERDDSEERDYSDYDENKNESDYEEIFHDEPTELHSLQKLCLKTVIKNFDRFTTAYDTSEDTALRRNLLFLQRAYTEYIIKDMKEKIKDSWLDFLFNEHLTEFHWTSFAPCSHDALIKRFEAVGRAIQKMYFSTGFVFNYDTSNSEFLRKILKLVPNLQTLHIPSSGEDETLAVIAESCPQLKELRIDHSTFSEEGIKSLFKEAEDGSVQPKCQLEILSLRETHLDTSILVYILKHMPSLQTLGHNQAPFALYSMHKDDFESCTTRYNLTSIEMPYSAQPHLQLSQLLSVCATMCPSITRLQVFVSSQQHLEALSQFSLLEELVLEYFAMDEDVKLEMDPFLVGNGPRLKELRLSEMTVSVDTLVKVCKNLESLYLRDVILKGGVTTSVGISMPRMRKLVLEHFEFEEHCAEKSVVFLLAACPKLEVLDLSRCELAGSENLTTELSGFCERCSTLTELHFRLSDVQPELIESILLTSPSLKMLLIHDCENIMMDNVDHFYEIVRARKNKIKIVWHSDRSEFNSLDGDFFDRDIFHDDYDSDEYFPDYFGGFGIEPEDYLYGYEFDLDYDYDSETDY